MTAPSLSIIICTYNRKDLLAKCLDSLVAQNTGIDKIEIIVVDNNSKDNTDELVMQYEKKIPCLKYVFEEKQGLSHARNRGCIETNSEYLAYLDNDAIAPQDYISNLMKVINQYSPDVMGGPIYPYYISRKPSWFKDEYEIRKHAEESGFSSTCRISGGNYIIRKEVLEDLGMFDVNLGMIGEQVKLGEERDILEKYRRVKSEEEQKTYYALECYVKHYVPARKMTVRYILGRYYRSGRAAARLKKKNPSYAIKKIVTFVPDVFHDLNKEIGAHGIQGSDYVMVLAQASVRYGNIVELLGNGIRPVFGPIVKDIFRRASVFINRILKRLLT